MPRIGHPVGPGLRGQDVHLGVDDQAQGHVVHRISGRAHTAGQGVVACLGVDQPGVDLPQPVLACIDGQVDAAAVLELALGGGLRWSHGQQGVSSCFGEPDTLAWCAAPILSRSCLGCAHMKP